MTSCTLDYLQGQQTKLMRVDKQAGAHGLVHELS